MKVDKLKLLAGLPISIKYPEILINNDTKKDNILCNVYSPTIKEIAKIGEDVYIKFLQLLLFDVSNIRKKINNDKITSYEILMISCIYDDKFKKDILEALSFFIRDNINMYISDDQYAFIYIGDISERKIITSDIYENIRKILTIQNYIPENYSPANNTAKDFMKKIDDIKNKYKKYTKDNDITLFDLVNALAWKSGLGIQYVFSMTIYQLYSAIKQIRTIDDFDFTMNGIYSGNVDTRKINAQDLTWIKDKNDD